MGRKKKFDRELLKKHMDQIVLCEDILRPKGDAMKDGIRGGCKLTRD